MKADTLDARDLSGRDSRCVIPTFQRPYVWNQVDQWEPLWLDVENEAEPYLEALGLTGDELGRHTVLLMNKRLLDGHPTTRSEREIDQRGRDLADRAVGILARPTTT